MFKSDGDVIHFAAPKVQANIAANTSPRSATAREAAFRASVTGLCKATGWAWK